MSDDPQTPDVSDVSDADVPDLAPESAVSAPPKRNRFADLYHERTNYQFIAHSKRYLIISLVLVSVSLGSLVVRGLNFGIEFEGGTAWQVPVSKVKPDIDAVRTVVEREGISDAKITILQPAGSSELPQIRVQSEVQKDPSSEIRRVIADQTGTSLADVRFERTGDGGVWVVTTKRSVDTTRLERAVNGVPDVANAQVDQSGKQVTVKVAKIPPGPVSAVADALAGYAGANRNDVSIDTIGPIWGERVTRKAVQALFAFFIVIAIYLSLRFEWKMAAAAIICVLHDVVVTAGVYSILQFQVTPATITAFLTILGFSLYDTVVVFDKVRENTETLLQTGSSSYGEMVNRFLNQVLMRSLSTSLVAVLPVASLLIVGSLWLGAVALEDFALALLVGLLIGAYSSIFVATPILAWWKEREPRYRDLRNRLASQAARREPGRRAGSPALATAATGATAAATELLEPTAPRSTPDADSEALQIARAVQARARQQRRKKRK